MQRLSNTPKSTARDGRLTAILEPAAPAGFMSNLRLVWKILLIVAALALASLAIVVTSLGGFSTLRYQLDNLYSYRLIPIATINKADASFADLQANIEEIKNPSTSPLRRSNLVESVLQTDQAGDQIIEQYEKEWITAANPRFAQVLQSQGRSDLQNLESEVFKAIKDSHAVASLATAKLIEQVRRGKLDPAQADAARSAYSEVRTRLKDLIEVNNQFASISNDIAQAAYRGAVRAMLSALGVAALVGSLLVFWVVNSTTRRLAELEKGAQSLRQGNLDFQVKVLGRDEIGAISRTLNASVGQLKDFQERQEQDRQRGMQLQENVARFQNVATEIAGGDLTRRGEVTQDVLGNVVDAVNLTVEEISYLLKDVRQAAESVNRGATQMNALTENIAQGAQMQAGEVTQVREQTLGVSSNIRTMAEQATGAAQAAQETLEMARHGREAVTQAMIGMNEIRSEMTSIAENIAGLNSRSAQIESIAKTLEDFASQTNLLALNASFEAAGAGQAGRRFAVVAEEIRKLAEESARETQRVGSLVRQVQSDIVQVAAQTQDGVREAETGYRVADTAGNRLQEIARLAEQSAGLASQISELAQAQVPVVEGVSGAVQKIAQAAETTESESSQGRKAAQSMRELATNLTQNLNRFKLPA